VTVIGDLTVPVVILATFVLQITAVSEKNGTSISHLEVEMEVTTSFH